MEAINAIPQFPQQVIVGQKVAGESAKVRKALEQLIKKVNNSAFDIADLLYTIKKNGYYEGYTTFQEYVKTLEIKPRKAQYLTRMTEVMADLGIPREKYEPLGTAKLREITSLNVNDTWINPETKEETPIKTFIETFIEQGKEMPLDDIKQHVRTLKGLVGSEAFTFLHVSLKQGALDNVVRPALDRAKMLIGSVGKDDEGTSIDASDGAALEAISAEFLAGNGGDNADSNPEPDVDLA